MNSEVRSGGGEEEEGEEGVVEKPNPAPAPPFAFSIISASVVSKSRTTVCASTPLIKMGTGTSPPCSRASIRSGR